MNDREILERAAKAYWGHEIDDVCSVEWSELDNCIAYTHGDNQDHDGNDVALLWNPLTDDGDALRLAVKLGMRIDAGTKSLRECSAIAEGVIKSEKFNDDGLAATRRAIVRAAAAIRESMK